MNLLGIDFEEWYHPQLVEPYVLEKNKIPVMHKGLEKILNLLRITETRATFFFVGELLEANPEMNDMVIAEGHEIAFHTMKHTRIDSENFNDVFKKELDKFDSVTKKKSIGFRAPTFSLNEKSSWIIKELVEHGYKYDSSIMPVKTKMYGVNHAQREPYKISSLAIGKNDPQGKLFEFPLAVTKVLGKTIPACGGFYLRLLPQRIIKNTIKSYEAQNIPAAFYIHSWELIPEFFPKIRLPWKENFITFFNINRTYQKMFDLLNDFSFISFESYLKNNKFSSKY